MHNNSQSFNCTKADSISLHSQNTSHQKVHNTYTLSVPSSELGPHPLFRKRVCPPPETKGEGAYSPAGAGVGESHFGRLEKKPSTLSTLCLSDTSNLACIIYLR